MYNCLVLMSAYNGQKYIKQQIESIISQKEVNVTLIVRDDGSSDATLDILNEYKSKYPAITILKENNVGIHKSFARLIEFANTKKGNYVAFADQDDEWDNDKLYRAITMLENTNSHFYSSAARLVDSNLKDLGRTTENIRQNNHYMCTHSGILTPGTQGCTIVLTHSFFELIKNARYPNYYGHDTWITVVAYYVTKCVYDERPSMSYRQHDNSWTGNRNNKIKQIFKEFKFFNSGMCRYRMLAKDLLEKFAPSISPDNVKILTVLRRDHKSWNDKVLLLFDNSFSKFGFLQNLLFKFNILIGNV